MYINYINYYNYTTFSYVRNFSYKTHYKLPYLLYDCYSKTIHFFEFFIFNVYTYTHILHLPLFSVPPIRPVSQCPRRNRKL